MKNVSEIGEILKEARLEKGYTLDDLQQMTKIQKRYLKAIEEDQLDILPGAFYAKAFIKQYADIVGLDGAELLENHEVEALENSPEEETEAIRPTINPKAKKAEEWKTRAQELLPTVLIVLLVLAIVIAIYFAWRKSAASSANNKLIQEDESAQVIDAQKESKKKKKEAEAEKKAEKEEAEKKDKEENDDEESAEKKEKVEITKDSSTGAQTTFSVTGKLSEDATFKLIGDQGETWVSLTDNLGNSASDMLANGQELSLPITQEVTEITAVIGNAPATRMELDGQTVDYPEEASQVIRQEIKFIIK